jgi:DNA-binding MarR family transcriptional regulator
MCAERLLCVVPKLMQTLRVKMRAGRAAELTVPQFRSLVFFHNHPGAALSQASEHLGLALPSTSKLVETMVVRGYLTRADSTEDRRKLVIGLTAAGEATLSVAKNAAVAAFTRRLDELSVTELDVLFAVLGSLQSIIGAEDLDACCDVGFGLTAQRTA